MQTKQCELCGNSFTCYSDEKECWCEKTNLDSKKLNDFSKLGNDCFCENCIKELNSKIINPGHEEKIKTKSETLELTLKKKKNTFLIEIQSKKYRYPLFSEQIVNENDASQKFIQYHIKLKNNRFKIIRNIEALDENYRRVFSRVKYGILFK